MARHKVYFYRAYVGRDDSLRPLPFDAKAVLAEIDCLPFEANEGGRYLATGDGDVAFAYIDRMVPPERIRLARSRRAHLPPVERGGVFEALILPDDAGLAEESFVVFFKKNVVGCLHNSFSPRTSMLRRYVRARCSNDYSSADFEPLLRHDVAERLDALKEIRVLELRVSPSYEAQVRAASPTIAKAIRELSALGQAQQVSIILKPAKYHRGWLSSELLGPLRKLARRNDLREGVDAFKVKGLDGDSGRIDEIDVLNDQLILSVDVGLSENRSASLNRSAAYDAIETAYRQLRPQLESAAGALHGSYHPGVS